MEYDIENKLGAMLVFPDSLNHMVPQIENKAKSCTALYSINSVIQHYTVGITVHGYHALDKTLIQGVADNNEYQETIFLNSPD